MNATTARRDVKGFWVERVSILDGDPNQDGIKSELKELLPLPGGQDSEYRAGTSPCWTNANPR